MRMSRLFFDTTYTRTQRGAVGITRTVRRLFHELEEQDAVPVQAIAYGGGRFREVASASPEPVSHRVPAGLTFRLATSRPGKFAVTQLTRLPWPILRPLWEYGTGRAYGSSCQGAPAADFRPGDAVLLCDASWNYAAWTAVGRARAGGARLAFMVHDLMPIRHPEFCAPELVRIYGRWFEEMVRAGDAVICNSAATEQDLRQWAREAGCVLPPTGWFRLGADLPCLPGDRAARPQIESFLMGSEPCFAAVGSVEPKKNYAFLLDAFERLWADGLDLRLLIAGRATAECMDLVRRMKEHPEHGTRLLAVFDATDTEIARIYEHCRALVFPSLMEGFGLPLVEARTQGCPVIASDLPVFAELGDGGVFLYERHSAAALRERLVEHARADARPRCGRMPPFLWKDSAAQCLRVAADLLGMTLAPG